MFVTLSGIVMLASDVQPENAEEPMLVTPSGIVMLSSDVQPENAEEPMLVTLFKTTKLALPFPTG